MQARPILMMRIILHLVARNMKEQGYDSPLISPFYHDHPCFPNFSFHERNFDGHEVPNQKSVSVFTTYARVDMENRPLGDNKQLIGHPIGTGGTGTGILK